MRRRERGGGREMGFMGYKCAWLHSIWCEHAKEGMWQFHNSLQSSGLPMCTANLFLRICMYVDACNVFNGFKFYLE